MTGDASSLAHTVTAMRPVLPAKDFATSLRFYLDLGFERRTLTEGLAEMRLGAWAFLLQSYYVREWADNLVIHLTVADVRRWWDHVCALDLASRYGVRTQAPKSEGWGLVAGVVDPSGVLWRIAQITDPARTETAS